MAEQVDLMFLGEQIKRLQGDVRLLKSDMAQVRADSAKVESDVAGVKADIARVETNLEVFREFVNDRFDRMEARIDLNFVTLTRKIDALTARVDAQSEQIKAILDQLKAQSDQINAQSAQINMVLAEFKLSSGNDQCHAASLSSSASAREQSKTNCSSPDDRFHRRLFVKCQPSRSSMGSRYNQLLDAWMKCQSDLNPGRIR